MTHEEAFLADVREHPAEDAPRLIFADWLEENGDPERGEFIRTQVVCTRSLARGDDVRRMRARELLLRNWERWVAPLARLVGPESYEPWLRPDPHPGALQMFPRGFIDQLTLDARRYVIHGAKIQTLIPLTRLLLRGAGGMGAALAGCAALRPIQQLQFIDYFQAPLEASDMLALAESPHFLSLRLLRLMRNNIENTGVRALAGSSWLERLTLLDLTDNGLTAAAVEALAGTSHIGLRELWLRNNPIGDAGAVHLGRAPWLRGLTSLDLSHTGISLNEVEALRRLAPSVTIVHKTSQRPDAIV